MKRYISSVLATALLAPLSLFAQEAKTVPVGVVNVSIAAGTGTTKTVSTLSFPLVKPASLSGQMVGTITGVTQTAVINSEAGWTPGELSSAQDPVAIEFTSGNAQGVIALLSTLTQNTANTVTLDSSEAASTNLVDLGVSPGDSYRILEVETLLSFFGTPSSPNGLGVVGGTSQANADTVMLEVNGLFLTYFYNTNLNRWTRVFIGSPDASTARIHPRGGLVYSRIGNTPISINISGEVPSKAPVYKLKNSGVSFAAQSVPAPITIANLGVQLLPGWTSGANANVSDTIRVLIGGIWRTYWYDGTNWRRQFINSPISDTVEVPAGALVLLNQRGSDVGYTFFEVPLPYNLN